jgi:hypothetical protein
MKFSSLSKENHVFCISLKTSDIKNNETDFIQLVDHFFQLSISANNFSILFNKEILEI